MRIRDIHVTGLFGVFNHSIPMRMIDRITIIHGPNGVGKTAILRLINGVFRSRHSDLRLIPYDYFQVVFDNDAVLRVTQSRDQADDDSESSSTLTITIAYSEPGRDLRAFVLKRPRELADINIPLGAIADFIPELDRIGPKTWRHISAAETLDIDDVLERYGDLLPIDPPRAKGEPQWFRELKDSLNVRFIQTQRLLTVTSGLKSRSFGERKSAPMIEVVAEYSAELAQSIRDKIGEYAVLSQSLDRTFPSRLVKQEVLEDSTFETLRNQLSALEEKRNRLTAAGLLDKEKDDDFQVPPTMDERTKGVLPVYLKDNQQKLSIFDDMAEKIDLFKKIINERFKYKEMTITKDSGITFMTSDQKPLSPTSLSSGEQHELVLLYEFLFKTKANSLTLIDEPEISLHIAWQEQFLRDLQQITELASFDVLIATHSPQIIHDRWDLTVELRGPNPNGSQLQLGLEVPSDVVSVSRN